MQLASMSTPYMISILSHKALKNQWTIPLEWNGGMEYWNDPYSPCYFFPEAVLGVCKGVSGSSISVCQSVDQTEPS